MQNFVSKILSVYMLVLALVPCTDTAAEITLSATDIVIHATAEPSGPTRKFCYTQALLFFTWTSSLKSSCSYGYTPVSVPCPSTQKPQLSITKLTGWPTTDHDHSNSCTDDTCPPFCICDCCSLVLGASQVVAIPLLVFTPRPTVVPAFIAKYAPVGVRVAIWSPPRR
jgi:hypothetical protein